MEKLIIYNGIIVNEGDYNRASIIIENGKIKEIVKKLKLSDYQDFKVIDASDKYILPGMIDTHVHFREPGLTHKGDIFTESRAAAAGGITTFFDMPNTIPQTTNVEELDKKFQIAKEKSLINYSFYIGATNDNLETLTNIDKTKIPGIKLFYASSTGNMLVNNTEYIEQIFQKSNIPIVVHSEDNDIITENLEKHKNRLSELTIEDHPEIRSVNACISATKKLTELAIKHKTKLHFLHITTSEEVDYLSDIKLSNKNITAEVTPNHLFYDSSDYKEYGNLLKCNPAIKEMRHRFALVAGLDLGFIDTVGTDHAPHLLSEKQQFYEKAPSGIPSVQHALNILLEFVYQKHIALDTIVEKIAHNPAKIFNIAKRGFIKENYWADLVIVDLNVQSVASPDTILYKCGWTPVQDRLFNSKIVATIVNGKIVFDNSHIIESQAGMQVEFDR